MWSQRATIEIFHLLFLRAFGARVDRALYALKGGCNLRFFHKSIRYSEDMDLDIRTMSGATLRGNVDRVLDAPAFAQTLRAQQIEVVRVSRPKQTETTQRWKVGLRTGTAGQEVPTRIEFSRRALDDGMAHDAVDAEIIHRYRLYPVLVQHYTAGTALAQKVAALALRSQTQARDIFDLKLLLDSTTEPASLPRDVVAHLPQAIENTMGIGYSEFTGQVVAYLEPEYQDHYKERRVWDALQAQVVEALDRLHS
jgi:predicted nucleotidyltransferase component of viral defense system